MLVGRLLRRGFRGDDLYPRRLTAASRVPAHLANVNAARGGLFSGVAAARL